MSSNLVWSIKNGDAENVREIFEKEVSEVADWVSEGDNNKLLFRSFRNWTSI